MGMTFLASFSILSPLPRDIWGGDSMVGICREPGRDPLGNSIGELLSGPLGVKVKREKFYAAARDPHRKTPFRRLKWTTTRQRTGSPGYTVSF